MAKASIISTVERYNDNGQLIERITQEKITYDEENNNKTENNIVKLPYKPYVYKNGKWVPAKFLE